MKIEENISLKPFNTFGIEAKARYFVEVKTDAEILDLIKNDIFKYGRIQILNGGSNTLFTSDFDGLVVKIATRGISLIDENDDYVFLKAKAGVNWHEFVTFCIENNYGGLENLSLIPGNVGAAPIQNIGAYGVEQKDCFYELEAIELSTGQIRTFTHLDCRFDYRNSIFKQEFKDKLIILSVTYRLNKNPEFNTTYGAITAEIERMGVKNLSLKAIGDAVCSIRRSKLPDTEKIGNAGSFFKNPLVTKEKYLNLINDFPGLVAFPANEGNYKLAAGWLIENLGWKGFRRGDAGVCETQALVLVNYGQAKGSEITDLANEIKFSIKNRFGVDLELEVNII
jgi:UDP-N-acetylmuramate dehydrogenase